MPHSSVYQDYHVEVLERMMAAQRQRGQDKGASSLHNLFMVLDDCMYDKAVIRGKAIRDLFMNGRHYKITFLAAVQYLMDLPPALRAAGCDTIATHTKSSSRKSAGDSANTASQSSSSGAMLISRANSTRTHRRSARDFGAGRVGGIACERQPPDWRRCRKTINSVK